jgi:hypothetical protein
MQRGDEILARWDGRSLKAVGGRDRDAIACFPVDTVFSLRKWEPGTQWARAYITVFSELAADAHPEIADKDELKTTTKIQYRWIDGVQVEADGSGAARYKSVGKMDQDELARFTEQMKQLAGELGLDVEALDRETRERVKPRRPRS